VSGRREECVSQFFCHCDKRPDKQFKSRTYFGSWFQSILLGSVDSEFRVREDITTAGAFDRGCSIHDVQKAERERMPEFTGFLASHFHSIWDHQPMGWWYPYSGQVCPTCQSSLEMP
jgi:hypothetical protein